jgi:hypothetical protein
MTMHAGVGHSARPYDEGISVAIYFDWSFQMGRPDEERAELAVPQDKGRSGLATKERPKQAIRDRAEAAVRADVEQKGR